MTAKTFSARLLMVFIFSAVTAGCAHGYRFKDSPPVNEARDNQPSPVPHKTDFKFVEYAVTSSVRYPIDAYLDTRRVLRSQDVNAMDEVPASTWFTPRIGAAEISPEELVKGPENKGAPELPLTVIHAKTKGNSPGFIVKDARGLKYLIKFDRQDYPAIESTVNFVVNRLFWGFGYNVPEDFIVRFSRDDVTLGDGMDPEKVERVFAFSFADDDGSYRAVASLFLEGEILGPIGQRGTRRGDLNDTIRHENRRVLRALRLFSALIDNSGMRSDNSLDVYTGEPGNGHTVHYLVDFGEAFGVHGAEKNRAWDGFEHFFSFKDSTVNFLTFGVPVKKWEHLAFDPMDPKGSFEAEVFEPGKWKETTQFLPMRSSLPDDDYWAAKIIAALSPGHLEALFKAAGHPDPQYTDYILETLQKRREKILRYAFGRVSPLEFSALKGNELALKDVAVGIFDLLGSEYRVQFLNAKGRRAAPDLTLRSGENGIEIPVAAAVEAAKGYLRVSVTAVRGGRPAPRAAQFHIRQSGNELPKLTGIVH